MEWNDNIRQADTDTEDDLIIGPRLNLMGFWPATDNTTLSFGLGLGYEHYLDNSDLNNFLITPDSALAWDITAQDWMFTFYDRFTYSQEVASQGGLSDTAEYPRIENTVGVRARWQPDRYELQFGYSHFNFFSTSSAYDYLERSAEQFFGRAGWRFAEVTQAGVEASGSLTHYNSSERPDNQNVSVGPYLEWMVVNELRLSLRGGYVVYFGEDTVTGEHRDEDSHYLGLYANHRLTRFLTHTLSVVHDVQQSVDSGSTLTEQLRLSYSMAWAFHPSASLSVSGFYEDAEERQDGVQETYERFGAGVGLTWRLLKRLSAGLAYRYTTKDSSISVNDYDQNVVTLTANYHF